MQLVIPLYDRYHHVLDIYLEFLFKFFTHLPFSILVICGEKTYEPKNNFPINVKTLGFEKGWSSNMIAGLQYAEPVFMLSFEDCFIISEPKIELLTKYWNVMISDSSIGYWCLQPRGLIPKKKICNFYGEFSAGQKYCANFQMSFWRKDFMYKVLSHGKTAWRSEKKADKHAWKLMKEGCRFLCVYEKYKPLNYVIAVRQGKWDKAACDVVRKTNPGVVFGSL